MLDLSQFRGYRAADALTRAAPVGRTEFASLTVLFPCSNFVSSLTALKMRAAGILCRPPGGERCAPTQSL